MESLKVRFQAVSDCLATLDEALKLIKNPEYSVLRSSLRDSLIQRFKYTIDTFCKYLREYLEITQSVIFSLVSPREVLKKASQVGVITHEEYMVCDDMMKDRNLTSHTYNEAFAEQMSERIAQYYTVIRTIIEKFLKSLQNILWFSQAIYCRVLLHTLL